MPTKKLKDKNIRKLTRIGNKGASLGLTLPKEIVEKLGWRERQKVVVEKVRGGALINDWKE